MCTQSVGLVADALETAGISSVSIALLADVAKVMRLPRALAVPFPFGRPLGSGGRSSQEAIVLGALKLLEHPGPPPVLATWPGDTDARPAAIFSPA